MNWYSQVITKIKDNLELSCILTGMIVGYWLSITYLVYFS